MALSLTAIEDLGDSIISIRIGDISLFFVSPNKSIEHSTIRSSLSLISFKQMFFSLLESIIFYHLFSYDQ
jgi:hypothetical protein